MPSQFFFNELKEYENIHKFGNIINKIWKHFFFQFRSTGKKYILFSFINSPNVNETKISKFIAIETFVYFIPSDYIF